MTTATDMPLEEQMRQPRRSTRRVLLFVAIVALAFHAIQVLACRLVILPDSRQYIALAVSIADRGDFSQELFQFRPPGYPLILAAIFRVFGENSSTAMLVIQHLMAVAVAVIVAAMAWRLWRNRGFAAVAGVFCAFALHVGSMANTVMTEMPYTLALATCVLMLVYYVLGDGRKWLAAAALVAGVSAVIKPTGQLLIYTCLLAAIFQEWRAARGRRLDRRLRAICLGSAIATLPAVAAVLPVMINSHRHFGYFQMTAARGYALYYRMAFIDELDDPGNAALTELQEAIVEARRAGVVPERTTYKDFFLTLQAYRKTRGASMSDTFKVMERAANGLLVRHWKTVARRTVIYTYRTLFEPDFTYRFVPGGVDGAGGYMPRDEPLLGLGTYLKLADSLVGREAMHRYVPVRTDDTYLSVRWRRFVRWYRERIELGSPITGLLDSPYEELIAIAVVGGVLSLLRRNREGWLLLGFVVFSHVALSAFMQGPVGRYAVPVHPLMVMFQALVIVELARAGLAIARKGTAIASRRTPEVTARRTSA